MAQPTVINLNKARKQKARAAARSQADANAAKHGRTKAEKLAEKTEAQRIRAQLDGLKRDD